MLAVKNDAEVQDCFYAIEPYSHGHAMDDVLSSTLLRDQQSDLHRTDNQLLVKEIPMLPDWFDSVLRQKRPREQKSDDVSQARRRPRRVAQAEPLESEDVPATQPEDRVSSDHLTSAMSDDDDSGWDLWDR